jgi:hypothetical protein
MTNKVKKGSTRFNISTPLLCISTLAFLEAPCQVPFVRVFPSAPPGRSEASIAMETCGRISAGTAPYVPLARDLRLCGLNSDPRRAECVRTCRSSGTCSTTLTFPNSLCRRLFCRPTRRPGRPPFPVLSAFQIYSCQILYNTSGS